MAPIFTLHLFQLLLQAPNNILIELVHLKYICQTLTTNWAAVVVTQLVEVRGSNPVMRNFYLLSTVLKYENNEKQVPALA